MSTHTPDRKFLISVVGPTAVGKTAVAIELANYFRTEILSADSRQFYREMNIGTAKPTMDERRQATHHFVDSHSIEEEVNAGDFERLALEKLQKLFGSHATAVMVGGSGLYFQAVWEGFDDMPEIPLQVRASLEEELQQSGLSALTEELKTKDPDYHAIVDLQNPRRVVRALEVIRATDKTYSSFRKRTRKNRPFGLIKLGLEMDREMLYARIDKRMDQMIANGLFEEVSSLYPYRRHMALQTVGYSEIFDFMDGIYDRDEAVRLLKRNSRRYAKRQFTWFKRDPEIQWFRPDQQTAMIEHIEQKLKSNGEDL